MMAKATDTQIDLVRDLEAALILLKEEVPLDNITIGMLTARANTTPASLYGCVSRLQVGRHYDLLDRLREVFKHATKMPLCLIMDFAKREVQDEPASNEPIDSQSALSTILNLLKPFSAAERDRIISSTSMFFGIGM